jgi:hypothetical protein
MNADYESRGITASTPKMGLTLVGPNSLDSSSVLGQVHNSAMAAIEAKLCELDAKIAELLATLKSTEN